jgi:hypothetical protein
VAEEIKPGDIITCHRSGWWRVVGDDNVTVNYYGNKSDGRLIVELVMDKSGRMPKRNPRNISVHKSWCQKLTPEIIKQNKEKENKRWDTLLFLVDPTLKENPQEIPEGLGSISRPEPDYLSKLPPPKSILKK